jgi:hypothetical protein
LQTHNDVPTVLPASAARRRRRPVRWGRRRRLGSPWVARVGVLAALLLVAGAADVPAQAKLYVLGLSGS